VALGVWPSFKGVGQRALVKGRCSKAVDQSEGGESERQFFVVVVRLRWCSGRHGKAKAKARRGKRREVGDIV